MQVITILYPRTDDSTFDMDYYTSTHMPMLADALGDDCLGWGAASIPDGKYQAIGWATATSAEAFNVAMASHGTAIMGDVPNYTNTQPELMVGEYAGGSQ